MSDNPNVVETLEVDVKLNGAEKFQKKIEHLEWKVNDYAEALKTADEDNEALQKAHDKTKASLDKVIGGFGRFFAVLATATGIKKLVDDVAQANDQLGFLEKQLNTNATTLKAWQGAVTAGGGSAQGLNQSFKALSQGAQDFVTTGNSAMLPTLNALGVSMVDAQGHVRKTDDVMLDLADTMSRMNTGQAYLLGSKLGLV